jgi:hypothetical protein
MAIILRLVMSGKDLELQHYNNYGGLFFGNFNPLILVEVGTHNKLSHEVTPQGDHRALLQRIPTAHDIQGYLELRTKNCCMR